jgi:hypothetical protein
MTRQPRRTRDTVARRWAQMPASSSWPASSRTIAAGDMTPASEGNAPAAANIPSQPLPPARLAADAMPAHSTAANQAVQRSKRSIPRKVRRIGFLVNMGIPLYGRYLRRRIPSHPHAPARKREHLARVLA